MSFFSNFVGIYRRKAMTTFEIEEKIVVEKILDIYNTTVGEERIKKNCKFIKI